MGRLCARKTSAGRMVTRWTAVFYVGGLNPGRQTPVAPLQILIVAGFEPPTELFAAACITIRPLPLLTTNLLPTA